MHNIKLFIATKIDTVQCTPCNTQVLHVERTLPHYMYTIHKLSNGGYNFIHTCHMHISHPPPPPKRSRVVKKGG